MDTRSPMAVIHPPGDKSTDFLASAYSGWPSMSVDAVGECLKAYMKRCRVVAMGHGSPAGLYDADYRNVLRSEHADALSFGIDNIYVWCYASAFLDQHDLKGFATGMFISELEEAWYMQVKTTAEQIEASNTMFVSILRRCLHLPARDIYRAMMNEYKITDNAVVDYNRERMVIR